MMLMCLWESLSLDLAQLMVDVVFKSTRKCTQFGLRISPKITLHPRKFGLRIEAVARPDALHQARFILPCPGRVCLCVVFHPPEQGGPGFPQQKADCVRARPLINFYHKSLILIKCCGFLSLDL